jgi:adenine-specific DNA-methyltransferase
MFELSTDIPLWIVSYNDRSFPDIDTMISMIEPYRNVSIERKTYSAGRGGKGSVVGSSEILLICKPK